MAKPIKYVLNIDTRQALKRIRLLGIKLESAAKKLNKLEARAKRLTKKVSGQSG